MSKIIFSLKNGLRHFAHLFISEKSKENLDEYELSSRYILILIFLSLLMVIMNCLKFFGFHEGDFPSITAQFIFIIAMFSNLNNGTRKVFGYILSTFFFYLLCQSIYTSGGIYSVDVKWLLLIPLFSFLYFDRVQSCFWMLATIGALVYTYSLGENINSESAIVDTSQLSNLIDTLIYVAFLSTTIIVAYEGQKFVLKGLKLSNSDLLKQKNEIESLNLKLGKTQKQLIKSNSLLNQFAHRVSHDLKSPLRTISGTIFFLRRQLFESQKEDKNIELEFDNLNSAVNEMDKLIDSILGFSKLKSIDKIELKEINLNENLKEVIQSLSAEIEDNESEIILKDLPSIKGDFTLLKVLFQNVISNAIRYRRQDVLPKIEIKAIVKSDSYSILISDNGIGIPEDKLESIFEPFVKLGTQGTGIGLATCSIIMEMHKGEITVESVEGNGSIFILKFPKS